MLSLVTSSLVTSLVTSVDKEQDKEQDGLPAQAALYCAAMDNALTSRATLVGHLTLTAPAIAAILLVPFFGLRIGPWSGTVAP